MARQGMINSKDRGENDHQPPHNILICLLLFLDTAHLNVIFIHLAEELISAETAEPRDPGNLLRAADSSDKLQKSFEI